MNIPMPLGTSSASKTSDSDRVEEAVIEDIRESDNKVIEIRPAEQSKGGGIARLLLFIGAAIGLSYWMRSSQKPTELLQSAKEEAADRTEEMSEQAATKIQDGGETVAERVEKGSQDAGDHLQQTGEEAAEATEQAGEEAAEHADDDDDT